MRTILLADDEVNLRTLVRTTLEDPLHRIIEAADGAAALEIAGQEHLDLVVLDWMMPGLSGIEVIRALRQIPASASVPVLMLTAKRQEKDRELAQSLGVRGFLTKPFSPLELLEKVHEILRTASNDARLANAEDFPLPSDLERKIQTTDSQLAFYARDLKRAVEAERHKARELAAANARLAIMNRLKTDFVIFISHQLRNPLNAMSLIDLLDPYGDSAEQVEAIGVVRHGYERLHKFIAKGLCYFEWLAAEKVRTPETTDIAALVQRVADGMPRLREPGVDFRIFAPGVPSAVRGMEGALCEVIATLLENALRFSPESKRIRVDVTVDESTVAMSVTDRGLGFKPEMAPDMFDPFAITEPARYDECSGLSLALAKAIVEAHGGHIRAESPGPRAGATFTIELPLAHAPEPLAAR